MKLIIIVAVTLFLVIGIPSIIILRRKRDWMITHVLCPPEILFFETAEERLQVSKKSMGVFYRRPVTWIILLSYVFVASFVFAGVKEPMVLWFQTLPGNYSIKQFMFISFMLIPSFSPTLLFFWYERRWMRKYLRTYLNEHGMPVCMKCGYDLRGLDSVLCPECGTEFDRLL